MKRHRSSSSVAGGQESYGERRPSILDGVEEEEEEELYLGGVSASMGEKKRRLSVEQVKALEKNFEVENKLDPERKVRIAHDLGLQPRQVAVWFQNRRARWKNKQLERDYAALQSSFDALAADCDSLRRDKEALLVEIEGLKTKLGVTEEEEMESKAVALEDPQRAVAVAATTAAYKDGSSDSDSSAVVCDANSPHHCTVPLPSELHRRPEEMHNLLLDGGFDFHHGSDWRVQRSLFSKEEQGFLGGEEHCSVFFSEEQNPTFAWYCADHWS